MKDQTARKHARRDNCRSQKIAPEALSDGWPRTCVMGTTIYLVVEPIDPKELDGEADHSEVTLYTEEDILNQFWDYWSTTMAKSGKPNVEITTENCVQDWVVINWAEKHETPLSIRFFGKFRTP